MKTNLILLVISLMLISGQGYCCLHHLSSSEPTDPLPEESKGRVFSSMGHSGFESSGFLFGEVWRPGTIQHLFGSTVKKPEQPFWTGLWSSLKNRKSNGDIAGVLSLIFGIVAVTSGIIALIITTPFLAVVLSFPMAVLGIVLAIISKKRKGLHFTNVIGLILGMLVTVIFLIGLLMSFASFSDWGFSLF